LIAAGFPVLIEMGHHPPKDWWMGHYLVINGYDDNLGFFTSQDSLIQPDMPVSYSDLSSHWWRDFNYVYLVIYPPEREAELSGILGERFDEATSFRYAAEKARLEIPNLSDRDLFFAWFDLGSSLVGLEDYAAAAQAYDQAFTLYQGLSEEQRPYRLMWYQDGPYRAYYHTGRYQDVIKLANTTFSWVGQPVLEESYYWRGMAYAALGEINLAVSDFKKAALLNPNYMPPRQELERLGVTIP
jgi:tetratricopeptide (TPR) repeat protein